MKHLKSNLAAMSALVMLFTATACGESSEAGRTKSQDDVSIGTDQVDASADPDIKGKEIVWMATYDLNPSGNQDRSVALARELTKKFEEVERMALSEACLRFGTSDPRGEYVLVIDGKSPEQAARERAAAWESLTIPEHVAHYEAQGLSRKDAMKAAAKDRSVTKRDIYAAMLENDDRTAHI